MEVNPGVHFPKSECMFCFQSDDDVNLLGLANRSSILAVCSTYLTADVMPQNSLLLLATNCNGIPLQNRFSLCSECSSMAVALSVMNDKLEEIQKRITRFTGVFTSAVLKRRKINGYKKPPLKHTQTRIAPPPPFVTVDSNEEIFYPLPPSESLNLNTPKTSGNFNTQNMDFISVETEESHSGTSSQMEREGTSRNIKRDNSMGSAVAGKRSRSPVPDETDDFFGDAYLGYKKCGYCGKMISSASNLKLHERVHTGERPYKCKLCGAKFKVKSNLNRHTKRKHSNYRKTLKSI